MQKIPPPRRAAGLELWNAQTDRALACLFCRDPSTVFLRIFWAELHAGSTVLTWKKYTGPVDPLIDLGSMTPAMMGRLKSQILNENHPEIDRMTIGPGGIVVVAIPGDIRYRITSPHAQPSPSE